MGVEGRYLLAVEQVGLPFRWHVYAECNVKMKLLVQYGYIAG